MRLCPKFALQYINNLQKSWEMYLHLPIEATNPLMNTSSSCFSLGLVKLQQKRALRPNFQKWALKNLRRGDN